VSKENYCGTEWMTGWIFTFLQASDSHSSMRIFLKHPKIQQSISESSVPIYIKNPHNILNKNTSTINHPATKIHKLKWQYHQEISINNHKTIPKSKVSNLCVTFVLKLLLMLSIQFQFQKNCKHIVSAFNLLSLWMMNFSVPLYLYVQECHMVVCTVVLFIFIIFCWFGLF